MGGVAKKLDPTGSDFLSAGNTIGRGLGAASTFGLSELGRNNPYGLPISNPGASIVPALFGSRSGQDNPYVSGPFSLDPAQVATDRAAISGEGQKQFGQTSDFI